MENILNLLKKSSLSLDKIQSLCQLELNEINTIIKKLENERKVFLNSSGKYQLLTEEYCVGTLEQTSKGSAYVIVDNEKINIPSNELKTALKYDLVVIEKLFNHTGTIRGILERNNNKLVCEVKEWKNKLVLVPFNVSTGIHLITPKELLNDYIIGDRVYTTLTNESSDNNDIVVDNITKIGHFNDKYSDELSIAISKGFDIEFSKEAMDEAMIIPQFVSESEKIGRINLTNENIFTVDSIHTKDMDDAISVRKLEDGNYELSVHITDVAYYIKPNTYLFKEALKRGTSVYLGDVVIPMIPSILSNGICSLNENSERLTKSCIMTINKKGKVIDYSIVDSVIKSKKKMTYEELNRIFKGEFVDDSYQPFIKDLSIMRELSSILTLAKYKNGYINFESNDVNIVKDVYNNDKILEFENRQCEEAEKIIENFMIMANEVIATDFYWRELPFVYRVHDVPEEIRLEDTIDQIKELGLGKRLVSIQNSYGPKVIQNILESYKNSPIYSVISNLLLRSMAKAKYATENIGHYALSLDSYCHFTSPIRRFPDLIVHTLINKYNNSNFSHKHLSAIEDELTNIAIHSSFKERQAEDAEKDYIKLKMAEYMEEHKNEEFEGIILDVDKDKVFIKLDNNVKCLLDMGADFMLSFEIDNNKKLLVGRYSSQIIRLGTRIVTKITHVDIPNKKVYVDIKSILKTQNNIYTRKLEKNS